MKTARIFILLGVLAAATLACTLPLPDDGKTTLKDVDEALRAVFEQSGCAADPGNDAENLVRVEGQAFSMGCQIGFDHLLGAIMTCYSDETAAKQGFLELAGESEISPFHDQPHYYASSSRDAGGHRMSSESFAWQQGIWVVHVYTDNDSGYAGTPSVEELAEILYAAGSENGLLAASACPE